MTNFSQSQVSSLNSAVPFLTTAALFTVVASTSGLASELDYEAAQRNNIEATWRPDLSSNPVTLQNYIPQVEAASWLTEILDELTNLSRLPDGWKGPESHAVSAVAKKHTIDFLQKLSKEIFERPPAIGLDFEGTFSLSWFEEEGINIDLTIYEDGTYSFFAKSPETAVSVDDARVSDQIDTRLISILLS